MLGWYHQPRPRRYAALTVNVPLDAWNCIFWLVFFSAVSKNNFDTIVFAMFQPRTSRHFT
jgi:hypothetical protein